MTLGSAPKKRVKLLLVCGLIGFSMAGCSFSRPVVGSMEDGSETFTGEATGNSTDAGALRVVSNKGLTCQGNWSYMIYPTYGRGIFNCSEGTSGPFEFNQNGGSGTGTGRLGKRLFTFTFG